MSLHGRCPKNHNSNQRYAEITKNQRFGHFKTVDFEWCAESMNLWPQGLLEAPKQEIIEIHRDAFSKTVDFEGCAESVDLGSQGFLEATRSEAIEFLR